VAIEVHNYYFCVSSKSYLVRCFCIKAGANPATSVAVRDCAWTCTIVMGVKMKLKDCSQLIPYWPNYVPKLWKHLQKGTKFCPCGGLKVRGFKYKKHMCFLCFNPLKEKTPSLNFRKWVFSSPDYYTILDYLYWMEA
jgi:hypothetical protein